MLTFSTDDKFWNGVKLKVQFTQLLAMGNTWLLSKLVRRCGSTSLEGPREHIHVFPSTT